MIGIVWLWQRPIAAFIKISHFIEKLLKYTCSGPEKVRSPKTKTAIKKEGSTEADW